MVTDFGTNRELICDFLLVINTNLPHILHRFRDIAFETSTRRPASADRTARRQISGYWPTSESNADYSDAMTSRLPHYDAKCVQRKCFQWGSVPLRSDIKGTELPPANILIPLERQFIALKLCR